MIGPGTGLAPFRGFLRERAALQAQGRSLGPAMLFFGCRHPEQDFIYAEELKEHARAGIVDLHVAFSRHDGKKTYVQDLLKDQADRVRALIEQGAIVYVCGDGGRMEPDVKRALAAICGEAGDGEARGRQSLRARRVGGQLSLSRPATPSAPATCAASSWRRRALLVCTAVLFIVARHFEPRHWAWGYVAAFAAAATVGGLADWYAVVALFRRPLGLPIPHTAIIPRNHLRIADTLGEFIETNFLAPEPVEARLREVDFAALVADWLADRERSRGAGGLRAAAAAADPGRHRPVRPEGLPRQADHDRAGTGRAGAAGGGTAERRHREGPAPAPARRAARRARKGADQRGDAGGAAREDPQGAAGAVQPLPRRCLPSAQDRRLDQRLHPGRARRSPASAAAWSSTVS